MSTAPKDRGWAEHDEEGLKKQGTISIESQVVDGNARVHNGNNVYITRRASTFNRRDADILNWLAPRVSFHQTHGRIQSRRTSRITPTRATTTITRGVRQVR